MKQLQDNDITIIEGNNELNITLSSYIRSITIPSTAVSGEEFPFEAVIHIDGIAPSDANIAFSWDWGEPYGIPTSPSIQQLFVRAPLGGATGDVVYETTAVAGYYKSHTDMVNHKITPLLPSIYKILSGGNNINGDWKGVDTGTEIEVLPIPVAPPEWILPSSVRGLVPAAYDLQWNDLVNCIDGNPATYASITIQSGDVAGLLFIIPRDWYFGFRGLFSPSFLPDSGVRLEPIADLGPPFIKAGPSQIPYSSRPQPFYDPYYIVAVSVMFYNYPRFTGGYEPIEYRVYNFEFLRGGPE